MKMIMEEINQLERSKRKKERVACVFYGEGAGKNLTPFAEACLRFSPKIAIRKGEALFLEIGGSAHLIKEPFLILKLHQLSRRLGLGAPCISVAQDVSAALALARHKKLFSKSIPLSSLPIFALSDYASPFVEDEILQKKSERIALILRKLGIETLGDFSKLPPGTLASRLGKEGLELSQAIRRSLTRVWPRWVPEERISESVAVSEILELEPLFFLAKVPLGRVMARLRGRERRVSLLEISFEMEAYSTVTETQRKWELKLPIPQGSVSGVLPILRDFLMRDFQAHPLQAPVVSIQFRVLETAPGHGAQRDFFHRKEDQAEAWEVLVGRLSEKLGPQKVFTASSVDRWLPEKAWVPQAPQFFGGVDSPNTGERSGFYESDGESSERPLLMLKKPIPVQKEGGVLKSKRKAWQVLDWEGPERISGEWWKQYFDRDYYRVVTASGELLWIYSIPYREGFYLHGIFDS